MKTIPKFTTFSLKLSHDLFPPLCALYGSKTFDESYHNGTDLRTIKINCAESEFADTATLDTVCPALSGIDRTLPRV